MSQQKLLIISLTDARRDPRVFRQTLAMRRHFEVTVASLRNPEIEGVHFFPVTHIPARHILERAWRATTLLAGFSGPFLSRFRVLPKSVTGLPKFDLVLINDAETLPLGFSLADNAPVVFDAHEYYPRQYDNLLYWRVFHKRHITRICKSYIPRCAAMTTVCEGIAQEYHRQFGTLPLVIHSGPEFQQLEPKPAKPGRIRLIHHGSAAPGRNLETMIELMGLLDERFTLDFMLVKNSDYAARLRALCEQRPNIRWRDPVSMQSLSSEINSYDMGLYILPPSNFNNTMSLPNKFFEFIQARLGVAIGPSPEMARLVKEHNLGIIAADFTPSAMARQLNALTAEDIWRFKQNADRAAGILHAGVEMEKLQRLLLEVLGR